MHLLKTKYQIDRVILLNLAELEHAEATYHSVMKVYADIEAQAFSSYTASNKQQITLLKEQILQTLEEAKVSLSLLESSVRAQLEFDAIRGSEELREIQLLHHEIKNFSRLVRVVMENLEEHDFVSPMNIYDHDLRQVAEDMQSTVNDLEFGAHQEIKVALTTTRAETQESLWLSIVLTILAFLSAIGLGAWVSRNISGNVIKVHEATGLLGRGDLDVRVDVHSNDELGQIAHDINKMAEMLRKTIITRNDLRKEAQHRKEIEGQLRLQKTQAQKYLDIADIMLAVLDVKGNITLINKAGCKLLGYSTEDELLGMNWFDLCISKGEQQSIKKLFSQLMAGEAAPVEHFENEVMTKHGRKVLVAFHNTIIRDDENHITGVLFSGEDITESHAAEETLKERESRIRMLLDSTVEAIFGIDLDGRCTFANQSFLQSLGYAKLSEVLGKKIHDMMHAQYPDGARYPESECRICRAWQSKHAVHADDEFFWRKDGSSFPVSYWSHPIFQGEHAMGVVITYLDITEQIKSRDALAESAKKLRQSLAGTVAAIAKAVEARDPYTSGHQHRVAELACAIARELGLDEDQVDGIRMGASIHDIGKIYLPAELLSKPTKLSEIEYLLVQTHPQVGYDILKDIEFPWPVADIAHQHHECIDGSGYPQGLKGNEICLEARIVAVADAVEAISSHRPYRASLGIQVALDEIREKRGLVYDADVVDACLELFEKKSFAFQDHD